MKFMRRLLMIEIIKHKNINKLEDKWKKLYSTSNKFVPMADFEFVKIFNNDLASKIFKLRGKAPFYIELKEDGITKLILPVIHKDGGLETANTLDYFDCVFDAGITADKLLEYLQEIAKQENTTLTLKRMKDDTITYLTLKDIAKFEHYNECVKINFTDNYEEYYSALSKSARQNLRTAYNRAKTDGLSFDFEMHYGKQKNKLKKELNKIYLNRRVSRYNNMSPLKKLFYSASERIADVCFGLDKSFYSCLRLNGKPVAFMAGLENGKELIVPRLAINDKYSRYSLGIMLVNETIKAMQQKGYTCLDLATGTEAYKYQMGGVLHYNYALTIGEKNEKV